MVAMIKSYPMKQSTLVLLIVFAILLTVGLPKLFSGHGEIREEEFVTGDGQTLNCVIYSETSGAGGMDCFLDGAPLPNVEEADTSK